MPRLKEIDLLLLNALSQQPAHGYSLLFLLPAASSSQVYHSLRKMEGLGLIEKRLAPQSKAPVRSVYRLTRSGRRREMANFVQEAGRIRDDLRELLRQYAKAHAAFRSLQALRPSPSSGIPLRKQFE